MIDFDAMTVGQKTQLTTKTKWEDGPRQEYMRAQECTTRTGALFSVDAVWKDTPAGQKIAGYTITRTR